MNKFVKFPSISQYRNAIRAVTDRAHWVGRDENGGPVFDRSADLPVIRYRGTTKIHGTNAAAVYDVADYSLQFRSRERILTLTSDNAGFVLYMESKKPQLQAMAKSVATYVNDSVVKQKILKIAIFGEWCGGSIQKGVAISGLKKMFVIFAVRVICEAAAGLETSEEDQPGTFGFWADLAKLPQLEIPEDNIFSVLRFGYDDIEIDFGNPHQVQNELIRMTDAVEKECPVGKYFGNIGIGEGKVWTPLNAPVNRSDMWFKIKGELHSVTKVKTLAAVDVDAIESINEFVDATVTENRLKQGIDKLVENGLPIDVKSLGDFIRWMFNDIVKEEADTIVANQLDPKKLGGPIAVKARKWFMSNHA